MFGRLQDQILLFKTVMGTRKDFFKIYRQFGHAPSKSFASTGVRSSDKMGPICRYRQRLNTVGCCPESRVSWFSSIFPSRIWDSNRIQKMVSMVFFIDIILPIALWPWGRL